MAVDISIGSLRTSNRRSYVSKETRKASRDGDTARVDHSTVSIDPDLAPGQIFFCWSRPWRSRTIEDPSAWGYRYDAASKVLTPIDTTSTFKLHILGSDKGKVEIPSLLVSGDVVQIHSHTTYEEYYSILGRMVSRRVHLHPLFAIKHELILYNARVGGGAVRGVRSRIL